jgi:hypothetical protein
MRNLQYVPDTIPNTGNAGHISIVRRPGHLLTPRSRICFEHSVCDLQLLVAPCLPFWADDPEGLKLR